MGKKTEVEKQTEKELAKLEKDIAKRYSQTAKDLKKGIEKYFAQFADADKKKREQLEAGEISKEDYKQWRLRTMCSGEEYKKFRDKLAKKYLKANQETDKRINESTGEIFALNCNYTLYKIERIVNHASKL